MPWQPSCTLELGPDSGHTCGGGTPFQDAVKSHSETATVSQAKYMHIGNSLGWVSIQPSVRLQSQGDANNRLLFQNAYT